MRNLKNNVLIIGDSYSTFRGYVPEGYEVYYAEEIIRETDLTRVEQTWWYQVMEETGWKLILNDSWCGAPMGYTGYEGEDCSQSSSFLHRLEMLKDKGFFDRQEIHRVFVFGGTNDSWADAPLGETQWTNWEEKDLYNVLPAIACFFHKLREYLPKARIYCLINCGLKPEITRCMEQSCETYKLIPVTFPHMDRMGDHPTIRGMEEIKAAVMEAIHREEPNAE
ncbi:MAG: hypothetical protein IKT58_04075 [Oscillospiraceae bacterium]|nr:hypothetical protein [Oscillospiraceae bacterium]